MAGSDTATPSIRPSLSSSAAAMAAPPPLDTLEAMTSVLAPVKRTVRSPLSFSSPYCWLMAYSASRTAARVWRPQSFSGFWPECACLKAKRWGVAWLKAVSSLGFSPALKATMSLNCGTVPKMAVSARWRMPLASGTVSFCRSCGALPVPLSV